MLVTPRRAGAICRGVLAILLAAPPGCHTLARSEGRAPPSAPDRYDGGPARTEAPGFADDERDEARRYAGASPEEAATPAPVPEAAAGEASGAAAAAATETTAPGSGDATAGGTSGASTGAGTSEPAGGGPASSARAGSGRASGAEAKRPAERAMVVYQGHLRLRVRRLLEASETVVRMAEKGGGHVASLGARVIVVRIPASDFEAVMNAFATIGEVLDRRVQALDVTAQYTDLAARLEVASLARERLLELLAATADPDERLRIVKEVKRLTELIESRRATLATLQDLALRYTITIELVPVQEGDAPDRHRSPFAWVRGLQAHRASMGGDRRELSLEVPEDFVLFERSESLLAQGADTSVIRGGRVENRPRGDEAFWMRAVEHEMEGRDEVVAARGAAGAVRYAVFRNKDVAPRWYLVAVRCAEERVHVIEAFFPTAESYEARGASVIRALATLRVGGDA